MKKYLFLATALLLSAIPKHKISAAPAFAATQNGFLRMVPVSHFSFLDVPRAYA